MPNLQEQKYTIEIYRINVDSSTFELVDILNTYMELEYMNQLNGIGSCKFKLNISDPKASKTNFQRYRNQVLIKRYGVPVWIGPICNVTISYENVSGYLDIECYSYLEHLKDRYTDKIVNYDTTWALDEIAWGLVNTTQGLTNGQLKIVRGNNPSMGAAESKKFEYANIAEQLQSLSNNDTLDSFDFSLDPVLGVNNMLSYIQYNQYYPMLGSVRNDIQTIKIGDNIKKISGTTNTTLHNQIRIIGQGTGDNAPYTDVADDSLQKAYTRREKILNQKDVLLSTTLSIIGNAYLRQQGVEGLKIDFSMAQGYEPTLGKYIIGDIINVNVQKGEYLDYQGQARVIGQTVNVDQNGAETITPRIEIIGI